MTCFTLKLSLQLVCYALRLESSSTIFVKNDIVKAAVLIDRSETTQKIHSHSSTFWTEAFSSLEYVFTRLVFVERITLPAFPNVAVKSTLDNCVRVASLPRNSEYVVHCVIEGAKVTLKYCLKSILIFCSPLLGKRESSLCSSSFPLKSG